MPAKRLFGNRRGPMNQEKTFISQITLHGTIFVLAQPAGEFGGVYTPPAPPPQEALNR